MENQNNNKGVITLLVVIIVILSVLCVLFATGTISFSSKNNENLDNNSAIQQQYSYNLTKRDMIQAIRGDYLEILVDTDGNAYLYTIADLDYEEDETIKSNLKNLQKKFEKYSPQKYTYDDGSTELKSFKLNIANVLTAYYVHMGNGGASYFVFVKENGKLSYLSYDKIIYNGAVELKDIDNLENIVSVVENTYSLTPYVITSNGEELSLFNYIK